MKKNILQIDLQMFDGEASGAAGSGASDIAGVSTGVQSQAAAEKMAEANVKVIYGKPAEEVESEGLEPENHLASGENAESETKVKSPEERQTEFEALIKGEYKDLFEGRVRSIMGRRIPEAKKLEKQVQSTSEVMNLISLKYGIDADKIDDLKKAIEEDDTYWEDAAEKENLTVAQFKHMKKMEAENAALRRAQEEAQRITQKEQVFSKWTQEAEGLKNFYPKFDLNEELQNEQFLKLLGAGIDMKTSFETIHHNELLTGAMSFTAKSVAKKQADAIRSGQMRPTENGISSRAAVVVKRDPDKLTHEDFVEIRKQLRNRNSEPIVF